MRNWLWAFCCLIFCPVGNSLHAQISVKAKKGILDARTWPLAEKPLALNGLWKFYDGKLLSPDSTQLYRGTTNLMPQAWNKGQGVATYALDILLPDSLPHLSLQIPQLYNSYTLWMDGKLIAKCGLVGLTKETTEPQWLPQTVSVSPKTDTLHLVLQVANFHHHIGGIREPLILGNSESLTTKRSWELGSNLAEVILLALEGLAFTILFFQEKKKKVILYFALLCISWALRSLFSNLYLGVYFFPFIPWTLVVKIEYLTLFSTVIWSLLLLNRLFKNVSNQITKYVLVTANVFFILFTIVTSPLTFTRWLPVYLSVAAIMMAYGIFIIFRAMFMDQKGVWPLVVSILLGILIFAYDLLGYKGFLPVNMIILSIGYTCIFILVTIALLIHLEIIKVDSSASMLTFDDLYKNQDRKK